MHREPSLAGAEKADVCIVGGGFSGLGAALHLARAGARVVLLDQALLGWGASGRNGGQVHVGLRRGQAWIEAQVGEEAARELWRIALDAREHLDWVTAQYGIDCDFTPGLLHLDHKRQYVEHSRRTVELLRDRYGYEHTEFVPESRARELVGSQAYFGGRLDRRGGHLHPLKLVLGIARAARQEGARLYEQSPVEKLSRDGSRWRVETPAGVVDAERVLLAGNGYLGNLSSKVAAHVMPINNFIAVTEPLGAERARSLIGNGYAVADSRFVVYYYRITPDHRLLFGGGESYSYRFPADLASVVRKHIGKVYPQLGDVRLDYAWGGTLAITPTRMPYIREIEPGLYNIGGYSGMGVVLAPYCGKLVAQAMTTGSADFTRLSQLPVPGFPGGRWLRWPTLVAAMSFFALRDRL